MSALIERGRELVARRAERRARDVRAARTVGEEGQHQYSGQQASVGGFSLTRDGDDWLCDCPVERKCLHGALASRGLVDPVDNWLASDAPDARFALADAQPTAGLAGAAAASKAAVEKIDDDSVHVGDAVVSVGGHCDCPMGGEPLCLHRLIADSWARGQRVAAASGAAPGAARPGAPAAVASVAPERRAPGERLPTQDVERFAEILDRTDQIAARLLTFGLQRAGGAVFDRVDALIIAAQTAGVRDGAPRNAGLGRLVRALEALRDDLKHFQQRVVTVRELTSSRSSRSCANVGRAIRANSGRLPLADFAGATQQEYDGAGPRRAGPGPGGLARLGLRRRDGVRRRSAHRSDLDAHERAPRRAAPRQLGGLARRRQRVRERVGELHQARAGAVPALGRAALRRRAPLRQREDPARRARRAEARRSEAARGDDRRHRRRGPARAAARVDPLGRPPASPPIALVDVAAIEPPRSIASRRSSSSRSTRPAGSR